MKYHYIWSFQGIFLILNIVLITFIQKNLPSNAFVFFGGRAIEKANNTKVFEIKHFYFASTVSKERVEAFLIKFCYIKNILFAHFMICCTLNAKNSAFKEVLGYEKRRVHQNIIHRHPFFFLLLFKKE